MSQTEGKPSKRTILDYCRSVTGWVESEGTQMEIVPGAGATEEEFKKATDTLAAIANSVEAKWTCEWYAYQFQLAWSFYAWATQDWSPNKDSRKRETAKRTLQVLVGELGSQFQGGQGVDRHRTRRARRPGGEEQLAVRRRQAAATLRLALEQGHSKPCLIPRETSARVPVRRPSEAGEGRDGAPPRTPAGATCFRCESAPHR